MSEGQSGDDGPVDGKLTVSFPEDETYLLEELDAQVEEGVYDSRSDALRTAIRDYLPAPGEMRDIHFDTAWDVFFGYWEEQADCEKAGEEPISLDEYIDRHVDRLEGSPVTVAGEEQGYLVEGTMTHGQESFYGFGETAGTAYMDWVETVQSAVVERVETYLPDVFEIERTGVPDDGMKH
ncbi:MAG: ribbon-helix-helix domain-containing protein [Candidatus Nanohaloarchaea archaeon]|nr:ribbon-helix-helix domain-containing protein [Candidatus Nanohaloarchaea archaeon]